MAALVACLIALPAGTARADAGSLASGPGPRPGPAILYAKPAVAPQLTNRAPWTASPILVSGATAYRSGEFLYQDFLYDDHGARAERDPTDARGGGDLFSPPNGTYTYPTAAAYAGNAADLVELRVKPLADATAFRLTLNSLVDPELVGATVALGSSGQARPVPSGANATSSAAFFLTWHGRSAELRSAVTGERVTPAPSVKVDLRRRQVELRVGHAAWNPGRDVVRMSAGVGLWDRGAGRYLIPGARASAKMPGGAGGLASPTAFFNVAFRAGEPYQSIVDTRALTDPAWWRDRLQGHALADGDLGAFSAQVDFGKLERGADDERGVPRTGRLNRILASHFETKQGVDYSKGCPLAPGPCTGELRGRLQPYAIYVPKARPMGGRYQLTLLLHSLTANYNQFSGSRNQLQFGDRSPASLVITPEGRGPDGFYHDVAGADTFEVWADVARRYRLDPPRTTIAGYSMGGFGTFTLAGQFPDLFARAQPTVGTAVPTSGLASLRWVPVLMWNTTTDELVPPAVYRPAADALRSLGYRYELDAFAPFPPLPVPTPDHLGLAVNDQFAPAARFLGAARVVRDPPRVTYVRNPALEFPRVGLDSDHAYWLLGIRLRNGGAPGTIDVRSRGFGVGDAPARRSTGSGTLTGGNLGPRPFAVERTTWGSATRTGVRDELEVRASNVRSLTIDTVRARVSCGARVRVLSGGPVVVRLRGCPRLTARPILTG